MLRSVFSTSVALLAVPLLASAASVYHSPANDGIEAAQPVFVPADGSTVVTLNLWITNEQGLGASTPLADQCAGTAATPGDELCGWDAHIGVTGSPSATLQNFVGAGGVIGMIDNGGATPLLRANGGQAVDPNRDTEPIGQVDVTAVVGASGEVQVVGNAAVDTLLALVNVDGPPSGGGSPTLAVVGDPDPDGDGILSDGDGSGFIGDNTCTGGATAGCDDNCSTIANGTQSDTDSDGVGQDCDNCPAAANPRVAVDYFTTTTVFGTPASVWSSATGGQRDDDNDGYGNLCDGKFQAGSVVGGLDTNAMVLALGHALNDFAAFGGICDDGAVVVTQCSAYDVNEDLAPLIGGLDLNHYLNNLLGNLLFLAGSTCPTCPLPCTGNCPDFPSP